MDSWWGAISAFERIFWYVAIPTSLVMMVQMGLSLVGIDHHGEMGDLDHADIDSDGHDGDTAHDHDDGHHEFKVFSIRNLITMAATFGWAGIAGNRWGFTKPVTLIFALLLGFVVAMTMAGILYLFMNLKSSGTMKIQNALEQVGSVYLPIPAEKAGMGMIQVPVQGSIRELSAQTLGRGLQTGEKVRVVEIIDRETVLVEKI